MLQICKKRVFAWSKMRQNAAIDKSDKYSPHLALIFSELEHLFVVLSI